MDRKVKAGFSILEVLVVMAIIAILMSFAYRWVLGVLANQRLKNAQDVLLSDLENTRLRSLISDVPLGVVNTGTNGYAIFRDENRNCQFDNNERIRDVPLPPGITLGNDFSVLFDRKGIPRGQDCNTIAQTEVRIRNTFNTTRRVIIEPSGRIRGVSQ